MWIVIGCGWMLCCLMQVRCLVAERLLYTARAETHGSPRDEMENSPQKQLNIPISRKWRGISRVLGILRLDGPFKAATYAYFNLTFTFNKMTSSNLMGQLCRGPYSMKYTEYG